MEQAPTKEDTTGSIPPSTPDTDNKSPLQEVSGKEKSPELKQEFEQGQDDNISNAKVEDTDELLVEPLYLVTDHEPSSSDTIVEGIPDDALVFCCQPESKDVMNLFPCKQCDTVAGCIFCLKSHYESVHLNLGIIQYKCNQMTYMKNYTETCNKCNLVCECKEEMIEHRKVHFVTCDVCDMTFDNALFLSNHCKATHDKFEVIISCDLCEQWFKLLQDLSDHYEQFHEMILCIVCFRRFQNRDELTQHHGTHKILLNDYQNVLPYACSKCDQAFAEISELSSHLMRDHPKAKAGYGSVVSKLKMRTKANGSAKRRPRRSTLGQFDDCGGLSYMDNVPEEEDEFNMSGLKKVKTNNC